MLTYFRFAREKKLPVRRQMQRCEQKEIDRVRKKNAHTFLIYDYDFIYF